MYVISAFLGSGAIVMTAVSPRTAMLILAGMIVAVLYGAKRLGILKMKRTARN